MSDGGPAFPAQYMDFQLGTGDQVVREQWLGITALDFFAAAALQGLLADSRKRVSYPQVDNEKDSRAEFAYAQAAAMVGVKERLEHREGTDYVLAADHEAEVASWRRVAERLESEKAEKDEELALLRNRIATWAKGLQWADGLTGIVEEMEREAQADE